jgi:hypothetical protein
VLIRERLEYQGHVVVAVEPLEERLEQYIDSLAREGRADVEKPK